jgi:hypothetical protein
MELVVCRDLVQGLRRINEIHVLTLTLYQVLITLSKFK